ncbi:MAG: biotin-dependent carboxyltransferase family protein [Chloroflexota bacterium]|nr:biotin-dependent carboxyltransferase family protein [Chloroflexota bacterium]
MIEVVEAGILTSVQTASGRPGWRHLGVGVGGAADAWSARLANRLVGNPDDAPLLEMTLSGPLLRFERSTAVAMAGATFDATLDGMPMPAGVGRLVRAGGVLRIGDGDGARGYLAVAGGIAEEPVLGSAATDLPSGFGGHDGRALQVGDRLSCGSSEPVTRRWTGRAPAGPIRIVPGPHHGRAAERVLNGTLWAVSSQADRTGFRLDGAAVDAGPKEVASMGLPIGAIQIPADGRPIVMLADHPVTGGYPVPACVIRADLGRVARLRPADRLRLASVSLAEAREALREAEGELAALEDAEPLRDDELGWTGALD